MSGTTQLKVLETIWDWGGEASISTIAKELRISTDYTRLICEDLGRHDYIDFLHSRLCVLRGKGKLEVAKLKADKAPKRIVVSDSAVKWGPGKNKKGRLIIDY